jgi:hypothetical protein
MASGAKGGVQVEADGGPRRRRECSAARLGVCERLVIQELNR